MKKLTGPQILVIEAMQDGWKLYSAHGLSAGGSHAWLMQKGNPAHKRAQLRTVNVLRDLGLIEAQADEHRFWRMNYKLTKAGRAIQVEH